MTKPPPASWRLVRARGVGVPASVRRFAKRARRRRLRAAAPWLIGLGVLLLVGLGLGLVYFTGVLAVSRVLVSGAVVSTPDEIRAAAAVSSGTPLATVNLGRVERGVLQRVPAVRQARVSRVWPDTLIIRVVERTAVAVVPVPAGGFVGVDDSGTAFLPLDSRPPDLPLLRLDSPGPHDATTRAALTVLDALPPALRTPLAQLVAEAPTRIRLELTDGRTVVWGDATENEEKVNVGLSLLNGPGKVIDVSAPRVVTVR
jgi:cell division protein FtsQ